MVKKYANKTLRKKNMTAERNRNRRRAKRKKELTTNWQRRNADFFEAERTQQHKNANVQNAESPKPEQK